MTNWFRQDWRDLSGEPSRLVAQLTDRLLTEKRPIDRHYLFAELEKTLSSCREALPDALVEYYLSTTRCRDGGDPGKRAARYRARLDRKGWPAGGMYSERPGAQVAVPVGALVQVVVPAGIG